MRKSVFDEVVSCGTATTRQFRYRFFSGSNVEPAWIGRVPVSWLDTAAMFGFPVETVWKRVWTQNPLDPSDHVGI